MKMIIDIPENMDLRNYNIPYDILNIITSGIPLPDHHGNLDKDKAVDYSDILKASIIIKKEDTNMTDIKVVDQLIDLKCHCEDMCDETNDVWERDIEALERAIELIRNRIEGKDIMKNVVNMIWDIAKISPEYGNALMDVLGDDVYEKIGKLTNEE